jgi:hypothetical protein
MIWGSSLRFKLNPVLTPRSQTPLPVIFGVHLKQTVALFLCILMSIMECVTRAACQEGLLKNEEKTPEESQ